jgi:hypothetical protein
VARPPYTVKTPSVPERHLYVCTPPVEGDRNVFADASSTEVRRRLEQNEPLDGIMYPSAERYLRDTVLPQLNRNAVPE